MTGAKNFRWTAAGVVATVAMMGCLPDPAFPDEPALTFVALEELAGVADGRNLVLHFTDGDGNVGLAQSDTLAPFCPTCDHHQNLKCEYDELRNGEWTHIPLNPEAGQVPFYYRVHRVEPSGTDPAQNGTIEVEMATWYLPTAYDTLRFRITLEDRDLNLSNEVVTPAFVKP
jgi:hypothetical protein